MLDLKDLRLITAIAQAGTLARAARSLGIGQPNVTRALAAIEANLRAPLFDRNRRGVLPTDTCRAVLAEAGQILERMEHLNSQLGAVRGGQTEDLVVAAGAYVAEALGAGAAARMIELFPNTRLRFAMANWAEVPMLVRERKAGLGILNIGDLGDAHDLVVERLRPQPGIFVVRAGHPLLQVPRLSLADILAWPLIFPTRAPSLVQGPMASARAEAMASGRAHGAFPGMVVESPHFGLLVVRGSDAVSPVPHMLAARAIAAGGVQVLPFHQPWMYLDWGIIRLRGRGLAEPEEAFMDLLRDAHRAAEERASGFFAEQGISLTPPGLSTVPP
jgi:DNA-binding transcriptional LysR family regulator